MYIYVYVCIKQHMSKNHTKYFVLHTVVLHTVVLCINLLQQQE